MTRFILIFLIQILVLNVSAQNTKMYKLNGHVDGPIIGIAAGSLFYANKLDQDFLPLTASELARFDYTDYFEDVPAFDRGALYNWNPKLAEASNYTLDASHILAVGLAFSKPVRHEAPTVGIMFIETIALTHGMTNLSKILLKRNRPYVFNPEVDIESKLNTNSRKSFFSGHTSSSAAATFFTARVFSDYYPESKWKPVVWTAAAALPAVTGYLRYESGKHFVSDVVVGYVVGAGIGYLVPMLHKNKINTNPSSQLMFEVTPMYNGVGFKSAFVF